MSTPTMTRDEPRRPPTRRRWLRILLALVVAAPLVLVVVAVSVHAVHQRQERAMRAELRAAFPDISDARWVCDHGDPSEGRTAYGCSKPGADEFGPSVLFIAYDAPVGERASVDAIRQHHDELEAADHSGYHRELTLLGVTGWAPTSGAARWGSVSRWWSDSDEPGIGSPVWTASFRYDDRPFGVDISAFSSAELAEVIDSLQLPDPSTLPD